MKRFDFDCESCGRFEAFVSEHIAAGPCACPVCDGNALRLFPIPQLPMMHDSKNMDPGEVQMHLDHKADVERGIACGEYKDVKVQGPREFQPDIPKSVY